MVGILLGRARADGEGSGCLRSLAPEIPRLRGLVPGRWGPRQRPCPGGFHTQRAGQWLLAEGSGANWSKTLQLAKGRRNARCELPGPEGFLGSCRGASAGVGLDDFCNAIADLKMSGKNRGQHMLGFALFFLRGLLLRWAKKLISVSPFFTKSSVHNNCHADGS